MSDKPIIDWEKLIQRRVDQRVHKYEKHITTEADKTRKLVYDLQKTIQIREGNRIHNIIQDVMLVIAFVLIAVFIRGC